MVVVVVVGKCIDHYLLLRLLSVGFVVVKDDELWSEHIWSRVVDISSILKNEREVQDDCQMRKFQQPILCLPSAKCDGVVVVVVVVLWAKWRSQVATHLVVLLLRLCLAIQLEHWVREEGPRCSEKSKGSPSLPRWVGFVPSFLSWFIWFFLEMM